MSTTDHGPAGVATTQEARFADSNVPAEAPIPGAVVVFAGQRPANRVIQAGRKILVLGRLELACGEALDAAISRRHVRIRFGSTGVEVSDLDSRNGTFVNGVPVKGEVSAPFGSLIRVGGALLVVTANVLPFERHGLGMRHDMVSGPLLRAILERIALASRTAEGTCLLIAGESGSGKELLARAFHDFGPRPSARFVALNCATIPEGLAERLLFGSKRGAFSGAVDAEGLLQGARGGTVFLDEIAELPLVVQSKLLRMLETQEVLPLGANTCERVDLRICSATWRDLRSEVLDGRFRQDLYFRIAQSDVVLPALRERIDEIPWHIQHVLDDKSWSSPLRATATFVEACAGRHWPGNVRELRAEVRRAATSTLAAGADVLGADSLGDGAGRALTRAESVERGSTHPRDEIAAALTRAGGNVVGAARLLGVHRNKVRRWLERHDVDAKDFKPLSSER